MPRVPHPPYQYRPNPFRFGSREWTQFNNVDKRLELEYDERNRQADLAADAADKKARDDANRLPDNTGGDSNPGANPPKSPSGNEPGGPNSNVGGAPCPPGTHRPIGVPGSGGSGGDSTASTADAISSCEPDDQPAQEPSQSKEACCSTIQSGFDKVAAALAEINGTLRDKLTGGKKDVDATLDELLDKLREKYEKGEKTCKQCQSMLKRGMGGTLEYAIQCAGACIGKAACECSMGDPDCWGEPCEGCGEPCCKCEKGICKPTPCPDEDKPQKFIGWCSSATGSIAVTKAEDGPPGAGFYQVAMGDDEQAVAIEAAKNCSKADLPSQSGPPDESIPVIEGPQGSCEFDVFVNGGGARFLASRQIANNMAAGIAQANQAIMKVGFEGVNLGSVGEVAKGFSRAANGAPGHYFKELLPQALAAIGCNSKVFKDSLATLAAVQSITGIAGVDLSPWTDQVKYIANLHCRQQFMNPDQALAAYLADQISYEKLDNHWGIANFCPESVRDTTMASRSKPVPLQLAIMRRRKLIDAGGYAKGMRQLGYLESGVAEQLFQLTEQVPPMSDIIRFMVKDADDPLIVDTFKLDAKFDDKYNKQLRKWGEAQGIPDDVARYNWRAHWTIPSPGQLFTFYQRLRDNPKFGGRNKVLDDVKLALIQQDILPYWHEHYLAVSFHPMGRIDIRRAFNIGAMKDDELEPAYRQLGYSDETSEKLAKFSVKLRSDSAVGHRAIKLWLKFAISRAEARQRMVDGGLPESVVDPALSDAEMSFASSAPSAAFVRGDLNRQQFTDRLESVGVTAQTATKIADILALKVTTHPIAKGFAAGVVDYDTAKSTMTDFGMAEQVADNVLSGIEQTIDYAFAIACQKGIKRRYLLGEFDAQQAQNELVTRSVSLARANKLIENWNCERSAIGKAVATNKLCDWLGRGVISSIEFATRLVRLGHSEIDAARIRDDCLAAISVKRQKQADKDAKDHVSLERREQAAMKRQNAAINRLAGQQLRATQRAANTRRNRQKQELSAASKVSKKCDCDLYDSQQIVNGQVARVQREYGLTIDEGLQLAIKAAEAWEGGEVASYTDTVTTLALGLGAVEEMTPA